VTAGGRRSLAGRPATRLAALLAVVAVAFAAVGVRLVSVQVLSPHRYAAFGRSERVRAVALPAERGVILDRDGNELALSMPQSTVWANPHLVIDPRGEAQTLASVLGLGATELQDKLSKDAGFVYLARKVNDDVAAKVKSLALPGVSLLPEPQRFLPEGDLASPILGKVGLDGNGLAGLELQYERILAGHPGRLVVERDPRGADIPGGLRRLEPPARGSDIVLTIDRTLQYEAEHALSDEIVKAKAKGGMALVMDTSTGEVLALANLTGDGNAPAPAPSNLAVTNVYEPGSVNKLITLSTALEEGVVRPEDKFTVGNSIKIADATFSEHESHPVQQWSVTDIMANSSNVGTIMIGQKVGKDRLDHYLRAFGLGRSTGLGFPGETPGLLLDVAHWYPTSIGTVPIGQGLAVTAMQMVAAYNAVANGGVYVAPKLVKATVDERGVQHSTPPSAHRRVISPRTAAQVTAMLEEVVRLGTGTAAAIDGYAVAGKTGTARKPLENARGYKVGAYMASFGGFVPAEHPALTAMVILDEPTPIYGGLVSAPVFKDVVGYALRQFHIPPPPPSQPAAVPPASPEAAKTDGEVSPATTPTTLAPPTPTRGNP
jgi:cell division protein FtsI (penicillin-binding protein 3)